MGVPLVFCIVEFARRRGDTHRLVMLTILLGLLIGVLGITSAQWSDKSAILKPVLDLLPTIRNFPGAAKGFNVNEIAGAMAWLLPLAAGVAIYSWRHPDDAGSPRRFYATLTFFVLFFALFLGQSRLAIFGIVVALAILIFALIPANKWRIMALIGLVAFSVIEIVLFIGVFSPDESLEARDEASLNSRIYIWQSAVEMISDYPLTGVGMNKYRLTPVRIRYPVEGYANRILPHAHNEWLQIGADLGIPGMLLLAGWHLLALYMSVRVWQRGDAYARMVAVSLLAGLVAHDAFGMGDAVTLWDRFSFVFWLLIGLTAAQYVVTVKLAQKSTSEQPIHHTTASGAASSAVAT
ncbi:MAG: O-antigen ligase family protein, partial [Anaerolineae bacterium]|nr:O-antigen ligase family protein [Anaerolineae bacterium]